jgi:hypothetical protein
MNKDVNKGTDKLKKDIQYLWSIHRTRLSAKELASKLRMLGMWPLSLSVQEVETAIAGLAVKKPIGSNVI